MSIQKTAFSNKHGLQRCMKLRPKGPYYKNCLVYLDDFNIYSKSLTEHKDSLKQVFQKLKKANSKFQLTSAIF